MATTVAQNGDSRTRGLMTVTLTWGTDTAGSATVAAKRLPTISGLIRALVTNPGSTAPTDNYDISLVDAQGADRLAGGGADRDTTNSETKVFDPPIPVHESDTLDFTVSNNAVNNASGVAVLYIESFGI